MAGHTRGDLPPASYFERFLAALIRKSENGELRVKGSEFDSLVNEATTLTFYWDSEKQEIVARGARSTELVIDVFRVNPENAAPRVAQPARTTDPLDRTLFRAGQDPATPLVMTRSNLNPIEDDTARVLESNQVTARAKQIVREMLAQNRRKNG